VGLAVGMGLLVGHASVASISVALSLPILFGVLKMPAVVVGFALPAMALTLWALRPNIRRLRRREENFLPIYLKIPPPICLSRHPARRDE
ncbi:MAG TPA: hypothetical protein PLJ24_08135, partial [Anaerolineae bacterium]|nr:hypothetical protein [Anaerolineae bacterium]